MAIPGPYLKALTREHGRPNRPGQIQGGDQSQRGPSGTPNGPSRLSIVGRNVWADELVAL